MFFSDPELSGAKVEQQLTAARKRLANIKERIHKANIRQQHVEGSLITTPSATSAVESIINQEQKLFNSSSNSSSNSKEASQQQQHQHQQTIWDWTQSYSRWEGWEDIEELQQMKDNEEEKLESIIGKADNLGHYHDHKEEREFFESSEEIKLKHCEDHRYLGNYFYKEGLYMKALEHYQIAITYYEYCFPDEDNKQKHLDLLRYTCLCNLSACYIHMKQLRKAIESSTLVLQDSDINVKELYVKALFRRAQAYRLLDEYDLAMKDLKEAMKLVPTDRLIIMEMNRVKTQVESYNKSQQHFAQQVLNTTDDEAMNGTETITTKPVDQLNLNTFNMAMPIEPVMPEIIQDIQRDIVLQIKREQKNI